jgi:hypothetical protein
MINAPIGGSDEHDLPGQAAELAIFAMSSGDGSMTVAAIDDGASCLQSAA